jgi:hypothetical protein
MSVVRADYFDQIIGSLSTNGADIRHYTLTATADTLRSRLHQRAES